MKIQNPSWETLRSVGQARLMGLTVFMPLIGYMILLNAELAKHLELSEVLVPSYHVRTAPEIAGQLSVAATTRLHFIYFGLTGLGIGSIIYSFFCPRIQKDHPSDFIYVREEIQLLTSRRVESAIDFLRNRGKLTEVMEANLQAIEKTLLEPEQYAVDREHDRSMREMYRKELMLMVYQSENWSNWGARAAVTVLYVAGFALLAVPSAEVFIKVCIGVIAPA